MIRIKLPVDEETVRKLKVGDEISLDGKVVTARDAAHKKMISKWPAFLHRLFKDGALYHCGPVVKTVNGKWQTVSAGPTTSIREEPYEASVIEHYGIRLIIGKGGMGEKTLAALRELGAVYVHATGGAASLIAKKIKVTQKAYLLKELGGPEALWEFEVEDFTGVVTMDANGESLHDRVLEASRKNLESLL